MKRIFALHQLCFAAVLLTPSLACAQDGRVVKGVVVDESGEPLPGAHVYYVGANGKNTGVGTNADGQFTATIPAGVGSLRISFLGMQTQIVKLGKENTIKVVLVDEATNMKDVVVTGYATQNKAYFTGAATTVKAEDIMVPGFTSVDQMLQGAIPGMQVQINSGMVGAAAKIRVRGTSSLLGSQNPVWVVDGVVQQDPLPFNSEDNTKFSVDADDITQLAGNAISWLNPSDIETITVLKDASATAIYGSDAANGVIVITTKKATQGKLSVSYSGDFTTGMRPRYSSYDLMNSNQLMQMQSEMYDQRISYPSAILGVGYAGLLQQYLNKEITEAEFQAQYGKMAAQNTDWFGELFRTTFSNKHSLSLSGGNEWLQNRTSLGYSSEQGESRGNESRSFTATSNTTMRMFQNKLLVNFNLKGTWRQTYGYAYGVDPFDYAYNTSRVLPVVNDDGSYYYHDRWASESSTVINNKYSYLYNIKNEMANTGSRSTNNTWGATLDAKWDILPGLQYQGLASYSYSGTSSEQWATERSFYATQIRGYEQGAFPSSAPEMGYTRMPFGGVLDAARSDVSTISVRNALVYDNILKDLHRFTLQLGVETISTKTKGNDVLRYGYLRERGETFVNLPVEYYDPTLQETNVNPLVRGSQKMINRTHNRLSEYFSLAYTYDNRYVLNFNGRMDASNRFGQDKNKRFEPTWSAGLKWRVNSEKFARWWNWLSNLDIIASYGFQGNAVTSVSPFLIASDGGVNEYYNDYILNIKSLAYPDLGWEKTKSLNIGIDAAFFDGRLSFTANYYRKVSSVLSSRNVPRENGVEQAVVDGGEIVNSGYDFVISCTPIRTRDFLWQVSVNSGFTNNEVNKNQRINVLSDYLNGTAVVDGRPFSTFYSFRYKGPDPQTGAPTFEGLDVKDGKTPEAYLVESGKFTPDFNGGLNMQFKYKRWSLYTLFTVQWGGSARLPNLFDTSSNYGIPTPERNASAQLLDRWQKPGDNTMIPSIPTGNLYTYLPATSTVESQEMNLYTMYNMSDARVACTDFVRCRQISLSYDFNPELLKPIGCNRLNLKASVVNPFLFTRSKEWHGIDPETLTWTARRNFTFTVQLMF